MFQSQPTNAVDAVMREMFSECTKMKLKQLSAIFRQETEFDLSYLVLELLTFRILNPSQGSYVSLYE